MRSNSFRTFRSPAIVLTIGGMIATLAACGKDDAPAVKAFSPVIAEIDGKVVALSLEEADQICEREYCEPNQLYHADFGRKKSNPAPPPAPAPVVKQPQVQPSETLGYAAGILGLSEAWKKTEGSNDVIVAVVDTGVQIDHPDLAVNIWANPGEKDGQSGADNDGNGYANDVYGYDFYWNRPNAWDDAGHGTHCAGIVAAARNDIGVVGVAPKAKIMPLKFMGPTGSGDTADAIAAIDYAVRMGAKVISNSWGGGGYSKLLNDAIQRAHDRGVIVVAAAGNSTTNLDRLPSYPASYPNVISVASTTSSDLMSSFSSYGDNTVTIAAPGSSIYATYPGSSYATLSGTSMATPMVAGALALALTMKPGLSPQGAQDALCSSATGILTNVTQCGRMNVARLVERLN